MTLISKTTNSNSNDKIIIEINLTNKQWLLNCFEIITITYF